MLPARTLFLCVLAAWCCVACPAAMRVTDPPGMPSPWGKRFSEEKATAEEIPCSAKQITVTERDKHHGVRTWIAFCGSTKYFCRHDDEGTFCAPDSKPVVARDPSRPLVTVRSLHEPRTSLTSDVGEFAFGDSLEQAKSKCESDAQLWSGEAAAHSCVAPEAPRNGVRFQFCSLGLCSLEERFAPSGTSPSQWLAELQARQRSLEAKYGAPNREERTIPPSCRKTLRTCLENGTARVRYLWLWKSGDRLTLSLERVDGMLAIRVIDWKQR